VAGVIGRSSCGWRPENSKNEKCRHRLDSGVIILQMDRGAVIDKLKHFL
jgi:hypothetical protein